MHGASLEEEDSHIASINIIPLVDVVLVLLIIFMVTTAFARDRSLPLDLPKGSRSDQVLQPPVEINVSVDKDEKIYVNGQPTLLANLENKVNGMCNTSRQTTLVLRGDRRVVYGTIMPVLDELSRTGIKLTLALKAASEK